MPEAQRHLPDGSLSDARQKKFYKETTFHALMYFGRSDSKQWRLLWVFALVVGIIALLYSTQILLSNFLVSPTKVTVKVIKPPFLTLPEVTLCSMRRINKTKADYIGLNTTETVEYLYGSFASLSGFAFSDDERLYFKENINVSNVREQYIGAYQFWKDHVHTGNEKPSLARMLKYLSQQCIPNETFRCLVGGEELKDCCSHIVHFRNYNGPCFRLSFLRANGSGQDVGGVRDGLIVIFQPPPEEVYVKSVFNVFTEKGLQMFFDPFKAGIELDPLFLAEGWEYSMSIDKRHMKMLPSGEKDSCTNEQLMVDNLEVDDPYPYCMYVCLSELFVETCSCKPINNLFLVKTEAPYCWPDDVIGCVERKPDKIRENAAACGARCKHACHERQYLVTSTALPLQPAPKHARYVIFEEIDTTSWFSFISNVGGCLGLWTGASVVSIVHCAIYLYSVWIKRQRKWKCTAFSEQHATSVAGRPQSRDQGSSVASATATTVALVTPPIQDTKQSPAALYRKRHPDVTGSPSCSTTGVYHISWGDKL